jgi:hypothetical protein
MLVTPKTTVGNTHMVGLNSAKSSYLLQYIKGVLSFEFKSEWLQEQQ